MHERAKGVEVRLEHVTKTYGADVAAVRDTSLVVRPGEFMTMLGPSGSGKSTMLNVIAGFVEPSSGRVVIGDQDVTSVRPHRRNVGLVFQNYALFPHMSVFRNIAFPLARRALRKDEVRRRVTAMIEVVKLGGLEQRMPNELSGGQQQRVALARALVFEPDVLLLDEPLGALDKKLREHLQLEIKRIHTEVGGTFVHVTHDQEEALVMSDRIAVVNRGRIEQLGTPDEIYRRPASAFVADFIGESNIFAGPAVADGDVLRVAHQDVELACPPAGRLSGSGEVAVVVRPERVRLRGADDAAACGPNAVAGIVRQVVYLGNARRFEVDLPSGKTVVARVDVDGAAPGAGDRVVVSWAAEDAVAVPPERLDESADAPGGGSRCTT